MEKKIIEKWIANDGEEFNTSEECIAYENDNPLVKYSDDIIAKDYYGSRLFIWSNEIYTLEVKSREAADALDSIYGNYVAFSLPSSPHNNYGCHDTKGRFILIECSDGGYEWIDFDRAYAIISGSVFPK